MVERPCTSLTADESGHSAAGSARTIVQLEAIFVTGAAGSPMIRVSSVEAIVGRGLAGDRYALAAGYYSGKDSCEVTLIDADALARMSARYGVSVGHGEHRRNLVTRGLALRDLAGKRLVIGAVMLEFDRPRPPCGYLERLTEPGMTRALGLGSGIGARVIAPGRLQEGAEITVVPMEGAPTPRYLP